MTKIWVENGIDVDPTWNNHIAFSYDNVTWQTINKSGLGVYLKIVNKNTSSPIAKKALSYTILLRHASTPNVSPALEFDLADIQNHAGWLNTLAGLNAAIAEITDWLGDDASTSVSTLLSPASRTHNFLNVSTSGTVPAGTLRGSVMNIGAIDGEWNGEVIPRGVTVPWGDIFSRDEYDSIDYDATGTNFLIEYTT